MGRTLILTSPAERGPDVTLTQRLMSGQEGSPYVVFHGHIDGVYGPATAAAVKHGKYVLGYPLPEVDERAGDTFRGLLRTPVVKLPDDYQERRKQRLDPPPTPPRVLALHRAASQVGVKESPAGSNEQRYGAWYGWNGVSWCAIFASWASEPYEPHTFVRGDRYAYVPAILRDAWAHRNGLAVVQSPIPGDLVLYFWSGYHADERESHIGILESGNPSAWVSIEGNTVPDGATGSQGSGGEVCRRHRDRSHAAEVYFVRVGA